MKQRKWPLSCASRFYASCSLIFPARKTGMQEASIRDSKKSEREASFQCLSFRPAKVSQVIEIISSCSRAASCRCSNFAVRCLLSPTAFTRSISKTCPKEERLGTCLACLECGMALLFRDAITRACHSVVSAGRDDGHVEKIEPAASISPDYARSRSRCLNTCNADAKALRLSCFLCSHRQTIANLC